MRFGRSEEGRGRRSEVGGQEVGGQEVRRSGGQEVRRVRDFPFVICHFSFFIEELGR